MPDPDPDPDPVDVPIRDASIRLGQFLKLADLAESGAHARDLLTSDEVRVNDEPEARRGRQLVDGDVVAVGDRAARVRAVDGAHPAAD